MDDPLDPMAGIDDLFSDMSFEPEKEKMLIISKTQTFMDLLTAMGDMLLYDVDHFEKIDEAIPLLLQTTYPLILLENDKELFDIIHVSSTVRTNNKLARILIVTETIGVEEFSNIYNNGAVDAILKRPFEKEATLKIINHQQAQHDIVLGVTSFVNEPPKLSKASFLALDPSLSFGDADLPLNFVGFMAVSNTVPKFTKWFEDTLAQDEYLLAGYLSSITALGDDLFQNKESLKEINFGGISVIFKFHETIQFSFLVKNLTRHNYENAEERITKLLNTIIPKFGEILGSMDEFMSDDEANDLEETLDLFNSEDQREAEEYEKKQEAELLKYSKELIVLLFGSDIEQLKFLQSQLENYKETLANDFDRLLNYVFQPISEEDKAIELIRSGRVGVLMLDSEIRASRSVTDFADFGREMDYSLQIILLDRHTEIHDDLILGVNSDYYDYTLSFDASAEETQKWVSKAVDKSRDLKLQAEGKGDKTADGLAAARLKLREDLEAYDSEVKPELLGVLITKTLTDQGGLDRVYDRFWESTVFDKDMLSGMVASLKSVGGEMFTEQEDIDALELGNAYVYVRDTQDHLFIYFVKDVTPNTSVIVAKEVQEVTAIFAEIIKEADGLLTMEQLKPFFDKIANKSHYSFTELFSEKSKK